MEQRRALEGARLAAAHHVHRAVEAVAAATEGVRVAAGAVVALEHEHALPRAREQRRGGEPAEAAAHDDRVVGVVRGLLVEPHARAYRTASGAESVPNSAKRTMKSSRPML